MEKGIDMQGPVELELQEFAENFSAEQQQQQALPQPQVVRRHAFRWE